MFNIDITWMIIIALVFVLLAVNIYILSKNNGKIIKKLRELSELESKLEYRIIEIEKRINRIENKKNNTVDALASAVNCLKYINTDKIEK
jgi:septal ring factor EnvC (AmiA/AmiB activator)